MITYTDAFPVELRAFYDTFEVANLSQQEITRLFENTLENVKAITHVNKKEFLKQAKELSKNNPEVNKLAVKILLEVGSTEPEQIDKTINALPPDKRELGKLEEILNLVAKDSKENNPAYLTLLSSNLDAEVVQSFLQHIHEDQRTPETILLIHEALENLSGGDIATFKEVIKNVSQYTALSVLQWIRNLKDDPDIRAEVASSLRDLLTHPLPRAIDEIALPLVDLKKEETLSALSLAKKAQAQGIVLTEGVIKTLPKLPSENIDEIIALIKDIVNDNANRSFIFETIGKMENKAETVELLKYLYQIVVVHNNHSNYGQLLQDIQSIPSENRQAALDTFPLVTVGTPHERLFFISCFSPASYPALQTHRLTQRAYAKKLINNSALREEFIKNMQDKIKQADKTQLKTIGLFLNKFGLWDKSFPKLFLQRDMTLLTIVVKSTLNAEIVDFLRSDKGLEELIMHFDEVSNYPEVSKLLASYFTKEELTLIELSIPDRDKLLGLEKIANPTLYAYLSKSLHFKKPGTAPAAKKAESSAEISESARKQILDFLGTRTGVKGKNWRQLHYTQNEIDEVKPLMTQLLKDLRVNIPWKDIADTYKVDGTRIMLYGEEWEAIRFYTSHNYLIINGTLDDDATSINKWCQITFSKDYKDLNEAQRKSLESAIQALDKVYELIASGINKLPPYIGPIYRGDAIASSELENLQPGNVFTTSKFFSCSKSVPIAEFFSKQSAVDYMQSKQVEYQPVLYVFESRSSKNISNLAIDQNEDERIYLPNQSFQIMEIDKTTTPGLVTVYLKEVNLEE